MRATGKKRTATARTQAPAAAPTSVTAWNAAVATELAAQHGITIGVVPKGVLRHLYILDLDPAEAARRAKTAYDNAQVRPRRR